ncbi:MAG: hypothetical protein IJP00_00820 [Firmicutes bacterium]|nr:hypothetical protein [Bacillota bacterium]
MTFEECLKEQLKNHQSMANRDVIKMCYQATFGAEHLLLDMDKAKTFFDREYEATDAKEEAVWEPLNEEIVRVNFGGWKRAGLSKEELFKMFAESTKDVGGTKEELLKCLECAELVIKAAGFDMDVWHKELTEYIESGMNPVHHSEQYRYAENPAYRVVKRAYL